MKKLRPVNWADVWRGLGGLALGLVAFFPLRAWYQHTSGAPWYGISAFAMGGSLIVAGGSLWWVGAEMWSVYVREVMGDPRPPALPQSPVETESDSPVQRWLNNDEPPTESGN